MGKTQNAWHYNHVECVVSGQEYQFRSRAPRVISQNKTKKLIIRRNSITAAHHLPNISTVEWAFFVFVLEMHVSFQWF